MAKKGKVKPNSQLVAMLNRVADEYEVTSGLVKDAWHVGVSKLLSRIAARCRGAAACIEKHDPYKIEVRLDDDYADLCLRLYTPDTFVYITGLPPEICGPHCNNYINDRVAEKYR